MATTKTLQPTNQQITIAAFSGEKPDHRQIADAESKMADAINALNTQLGKMTVQKSESMPGTASFTLTANKYALIFYAGHMTSVYAGGSGTTLYISGDDPTQYGFTLSRDGATYTLTRNNSSGFYFAALIINT